MELCQVPCQEGWNSVRQVVSHLSYFSIESATMCCLSVEMFAILYPADTKAAQRIPEHPGVISFSDNDDTDAIKFDW